MSNLSYKDYQQVLNLSAPKAKTVTKSQTTKRRTKTGCLTCRKRKKKCDEDVVGGKCQGCTRNFLECCWPGSPTSSSASSPVSSEAEAASPCIEIKPKLEEPKTPSIQAAYPSPEMSPVFEGKAENCDILSLSLPKGQFKVTKPKKVVKKPQEPTKFVITSVEKRRLVHVK